MAKKLTANGEDPPLNSIDRQRIIRECCTEISVLEARRKQIGDQIGEIKQKRIKGDLRMKIADFNAGYRLYQLEGDARESYIDALKEIFAANGVGFQMDFLAPEGEAALRVKGYTEEDLEDLRENGRQAARQYRDREKSNPHSDDAAHPALSMVWLLGFDAETAKMAGEALGGDKSAAG